MRSTKTVFYVAWIMLACFSLSSCINSSLFPNNPGDLTEQAALQQTQSAAAETDTPVDPQALRLTEDVLGTQRAEINERLQATEDQQIIGATQQEQASLAAKETADAIVMMTAQAEDLKKNLVWKGDFETGNLSQWKGKGEFLNQGSGMYSLITSAHRGNFAASLTIDTDAPSETGAHAAYLFFYQALPEDAYYYSAWYFIPENVRIKEWWSIMQWKSTYDGNSDNSIRVFSVSIQRAPNGLELVVNQRPQPNEEDGNNVVYNQDKKLVPIGQWFQIEVYYQRADDNTGKVIVWQDGDELFNISNVRTVFSDKTIYWSVHNYSNSLSPSPLSIYVDDLAISRTQVGDRPLP